MATAVVVAAVVEVVVNKRRKKFKSRKVSRVRIRSSRSGCSDWLVNKLLGCVANLCFTVPVLYFIFIFMYDDMAHLRGVVGGGRGGGAGRAARRGGLRVRRASLFRLGNSRRRRWR